MTKKLWFILCIFISHCSFSQCSLSGKIMDSTKNAVRFATVILLNYPDSSIYKGALTDDKGIYCFNSIRSGKYVLKVSLIGFKTKNSIPMRVDSSVVLNVP